MDVTPLQRHLQQALKMVHRHAKFDIHILYNPQEADYHVTTICGAVQEFVEKWTGKNVTTYLNPKDIQEDRTTFHHCLSFLINGTHLPDGFSALARENWLSVKDNFEKEREALKLLPEIELGRLLDEVLQGKVHEATLNGERVAKRMMATERPMLSPKDFAAFYAEVFRTASLKSDYVVCVYGVTESGLVLMELADNELKSSYCTFTAWIEELNVLEQVTKALHYAHEKGVVRRDVKITNLLIIGDVLSQK